MYIGILYMLLSSFSFALVNLIVKILSDQYQQYPNIQDYPVFELVLFRCLVSLSICIAIIKTKKIPFFGHNIPWLITRGFAGSIGLSLFFFTLTNLPMALATIIQYLSPVFTIIFAIFINKQKVNPIQWIFFSIALIGVFIIGFKSDTGPINGIWVLVGLISAVFSGIAYNAIIKCSKTDQPITVVMYFPLVATPIAFVLMLFTNYVIPRGIEWLLLVLIGVLTQIAQIAMTRAFNADVASRVSPVKYVGAIYALSIGFFVFDETLSFYATIGVIFILIGILLNTFLKDLKLKRI